MSNPPKQRGTAFETLITNYFKQFWPTAYRPALSGKNDTGDINGLPLPIECKNTKVISLSQWNKEAEKEAENANARFCPVVFKRRGNGDPARQWVLLEAWMLADLMLAYERDVK